jgi:subtilisin-like proprotein convertase family protein
MEVSKVCRYHSSAKLLYVLGLWLSACSQPDDGVRSAGVRDQAVRELERQAGAPVALEVSDTGDLRVLAMTHQFPVPGHAADPTTAALGFLAANHDVFQLDAGEATQFAVTGVDSDRAGALHHVTLQRVYNGIQVFQGAMTVHMDKGNNVFRVLGDEFYHIGPPTNRLVLNPTEAVEAAGRAFGVKLSSVLAESSDQHTVFTSTDTLDPIHVTPKVFHAAQGDDRFAYQVILSWLDDQKQQQYKLALIDAQGGELLANYSLINTFTGRVFNVNAQPTANTTADNRTVASFDGDPTASPQGWVGAARTTAGNNAVAATDLDGNNTVGVNETQPIANAGNSFDFPFSPLQNASSFRAAAVVNAFFLVNDWHDRTYKLGFTEASGNFQASNFGLGGGQNDRVNVDVQDGSGTNNANFATPPDGSSPRMQMFMFTINGGAQEDGDFDPTVIYHENTHGLSNRLVGGGSSACLNGLQSGGMGEGWSDFLAASFLNNAVVGAYVTGNATVGIRRASMANSPFTYANIKDGTMSEVHDAGEVWAATLWDIRRVLGAAVTEQLVVSGMKFTPCNPTFLNARDGILSADQALFGGANHCKLFTAFAKRQMGAGASSPTSNSTSTIVLSSQLPPECGGGTPPPTGTPRNFTSTDVPKNIPDNNATGVRSVINVAPAALDVQRVTVDVNITHTFRGDLVIQVIAPNGQTATLSNRVGSSADNFVATGLDITSSFTVGSAASGTWQLFVSDLAAIDVGSINSFALHITSNNNPLVSTPITMSFIDAASEAAVSNPVTVHVEGSGQSFLRDANGSPISGSTFAVTGGSVNLLLDGHAEPTPVTPVELLPAFESSGYIKTGSTQLITSTNTVAIVTRLIKISAPPAGVTLATNNAARIDPVTGMVSTETIMATTPDLKTGSTATVTLSAGTAITDSIGRPLSGQLTAQLAYFSPREGQALQAFPGSLEVRVNNDPSGNRDGLFKSAGMVLVEIRDANNLLGQNFSGPGLGISIDVPSGTINPLTNLPVANGDQVPLWSNDTNTNEWKYEGQATAEVQQPPPSLRGATPKTVVTFRAHHLSLWNLDWKLDKCDLSRTIELKPFGGTALLAESTTSQFIYQISYPDAGGVPNSTTRTFPANNDNGSFSKITFKNMPVHESSDSTAPKGYLVTITINDKRISSHGYSQSHTFNFAGSPGTNLCPRDKSRPLNDPDDPFLQNDPNGDNSRLIQWAGPL